MRPLYLLIAASIVGLDQITKFAVVSNLSAYSEVTVIPGLFRLVLVENRGIAFGLFSDSSSALSFGLLIFFALVGVTIVCVLLWKNPRSAVRAGTGLAFILGGAAGNVADRLVRGSVIDFLDFLRRKLPLACLQRSRQRHRGRQRIAPAGTVFREAAPTGTWVEGRRKAGEGNSVKQLQAAGMPRWRAAAASNLVSAHRII